jgi:hypothetical protein
MVGFGDAYLEKDGVAVWSESDVRAPKSWGDYMSVKEASSLAELAPKSDWKIHLVGALNEAHYKRDASGKWVRYDEGRGFA